MSRLAWVAGCARAASRIHWHGAGEPMGEEPFHRRSRLRLDLIRRVAIARLGAYRPATCRMSLKPCASGTRDSVTREVSARVPGWGFRPLDLSGCADLPRRPDTCRNTLMYFNTELNRIIARFIRPERSRLLFSGRPSAARHGDLFPGPPEGRVFRKVPKPDLTPGLHPCPVVAGAKRADGRERG